MYGTVSSLKNILIICCTVSLLALNESGVVSLFSQSDNSFVHTFVNHIPLGNYYTLVVL